MNKGNLNKWIFTGVLITLFPISRVHAYIDPGNASFLVQAVIAGILAITLSTKNVWFKVIELFKNILSPAQKTKTDEKE